jgi:hypothetical protein
LLHTQRTMCSEGITASSAGGMAKHPAVGQAIQLWTALRTYITVLGMTPITRDRIALPDLYAELDAPLVELVARETKGTM